MTKNRLTDPRVLEAAQLALNGVKPKYIAQALDVTERTIFNWLADPKVKDLMEKTATDQFAELRTKEFFRANSLQDLLYKRLRAFLQDDEKMENAKLPDIVKAHTIYANLAREMAGPAIKKKEPIDEAKVQVYIDKVLVNKTQTIEKVLEEAMK